MKLSICAFFQLLCWCNAKDALTQGRVQDLEAKASGENLWNSKISVEDQWKLKYPNRETEINQLNEEGECTISCRGPMGDIDSCEGYDTAFGTTGAFCDYMGFPIHNTVNALTGEVCDCSGCICHNPPAPVSSPTPNPVSEPSSAPTTLPCSDDASWVDAKSGRGCTWIARRASKRCIKRSSSVADGEVSAYDGCPVSCDNKAGCGEPTSSPTSAPTSDCEDDADWVDAQSGKDCTWVSKRSEKRCARDNEEGVSASEGCPLSCDTCPTGYVDDATGYV